LLEVLLLPAEFLRAELQAGPSTSPSIACICAGVYSATVNLPKTDFNIRGMSKVKEPEIQQYWQDNGIYEGLSQSSDGETFTLHDGPPYANGDLHCGHALNKILKDFVNRRKLLEGRTARFVPGWDTHGLPIELKVRIDTHLLNLAHGAWEHEPWSELSILRSCRACAS
jgi:isoleucyl-tRNA synthetase